MTRKIAQSGAYGVLCLANKKWYIGSSRNIDRRISEHKAALRSNRHIQLPRLQQDWNKFGEGLFAFAQFPCSAPQRKHHEEHLIKTLQTLENECGYNKAVGSRWGVEASIRNTESKFVKKGKFSRLPGVDPETPMLQIYIATFKRKKEI